VGAYAIRLISFIMLTLAIAWGVGCFKALRHNPDSAAIQAVLFAKTAIIERNFSSAYGMLATSTQQGLTAEQFRNLIITFHPNSWPKSVSAVEYEPLPGQKAMNIYLYGKERDETFLYKFVMEGTEDVGYKVAAISRLSDPLPTSPKTIRFPRPRTTESELF
jgi:hypothetical protein